MAASHCNRLSADCASMMQSRKALLGVVGPGRYRRLQSLPPNGARETAVIRCAMALKSGNLEAAAPMAADRAFSGNTMAA